MAEHALDLGCGYCGRTARPLILDDDGDLVCPDGHGCAAKTSKRHAPVSRSTVCGPTAPAPRSPDTCACGGPAEWQELGATGLVGCCSTCVPGGPLR